MRFQKRFVTIATVVVVAALFKFHVGTDRIEDVEQFRGANIKEDVFEPMIAQSINSKLLTVRLNDEVYTNEGDGVYMSDDLNIMVPSDALMEGLNCSAKLYSKKKLLILQGEEQIELMADSRTMVVNGLPTEMDAQMVLKDGKPYVPIQQLQDVMHFELEWDSENNTAMAENILDLSFLPTKFDLREYHRMGKVEDQGALGTCWAFASLGALQSSMLPEERRYFSVDHMSLRNSFSSDQTTGGEYTMGMAYLTSWQGPVYEKDDPYGDGVSVDNLTAVKHVQEIQMLEERNLQEIKEAIFKHGAVQSSLYFNQHDWRYYDSKKATYYYDGEERVNHDVTIIGWDDNYSSSRFASQPAGDGAFICQNSWGEDFGKDGIFYVSYYDSRISTHCISYTGIEANDNYDEIYQSDLCGWSGQLGYSDSSVYAANVFKAKEDELVSGIGFYATGRNTTYELYVVPEFDGIDSLKEGWQVASGSLTKAGYYTIKPQSMLKVTSGKKFAVVLKIDTPGATRPLAVEVERENVNVDLTDGESYVSVNGKKWESAEKEHNCNVCLKVYTQRVN